MLVHILCIFLIPLMSCLAFDLPEWLQNKIPESLAGDKYIFVGDDLRLTCSPSKEQLKNYTVNDVSFSYFKPLQNGSRAKCLRMSLVHVDDAQSATLIVPSVTLDDSGQYNCHIWKQHCHEVQDIHDLKNVGVGEVQVEYRPYNVSQFVCVFYNWNDSVNCTWQHPVNYSNRSNINISVGYTVSSRLQPVSAFRCPHLTFHDCIFKSTEPFLVENYVIEVNVTNTVKNITASKNFYVNAYKSVKPAPVINLSAQAVPGCITLSWEHSKNYEKVFRIRHQNVGDSNIEVVNESLTDANSTYCGYQSYTHHNFSVDCHPAGIYSGYWSDPVYIDAWTPMTAPNVGPTTINGSYTSTNCVNRYRNVTLMWQEVEESERNGIIDSYLIKFGDEVLKSVTSNIHLTVVELLCHSPSKLTIFAHNKAGYSLKPSVMVISPVTFAVPKSISDSFVVEISYNSSSKHAESLRAVWNLTGGTQNLNYTVFWCLGQPGDTCEGPLNWSEVPGSAMYFDFPELDEEAQKYLFGISVRSIPIGAASGIHWTGCLFRQDTSSAHVKLSSVYVENGTEYFRVGWTPVQCSYQNPVKVSCYRVKWCEVSHCNDTGGVSHEDVPASESSYTVSGLTHESIYNVTVQPVVNGQAGEEFQPWIRASPRAAAGQQWLPWVVTLFVVVLVVAFIVWCISRRNHVWKLAKDSSIQRPAGGNQNNSPQMNHATSVDSLMPGPSNAAAVHHQASNETTLIIPDERISSEASSINTSEEAYTDDPYDNSRTRLIKPTNTPQKTAQRPVPDYVGFDSSFIQAGCASAVESSSKESDHTDVCETVFTEEVSPEEGLSPASSTTGEESVDTYMQCAVKPVQKDQKEICVKDCCRTHILGQIKSHADHIILHVEQSDQVARLNPAEVSYVAESSRAARRNSAADYSGINVCDNIQEIQIPGETVTNVEPTAPSVIGAQIPGIVFLNSGRASVATGNRSSARVDLGNSSARDDLRNSSSARDDLGNSSSTRVDLGNSSSARDDLGNSSSTRDDLGNSSSARDDLGNSSGARDDLGNSSGARVDLGNSSSARDDLGNCSGARSSSGLTDSDMSFEIQEHNSRQSSSGRPPHSDGYIPHPEV